MAETDFVQSESCVWHLRGAEGDRLSERSEGRKLPQLEPRALATLRKLKTSLRGCFGGDARGAAQGAKPHNRPRLAARRAGVPNFARGRNAVPEGQKKSKNNPTTVKRNACRIGRTPRRAGVPNFAGGRNAAPEGLQNQIPRRAGAIPRAAQASPTSPEGETPHPKGSKIKSPAGQAQ